MVDVIGNLSRYLPFDPQRLITEGVIHINACLCTLLVLALADGSQYVPKEIPRFGLVNFGVIILGILIGLGAVVSPGAPCGF